MSSHLTCAQAASGSQAASDESMAQEPQALIGAGISSLDLWGLLQTSNSHTCARGEALLPSSALYLRTSLRGSLVFEPHFYLGKHPRPVLAVSLWVGLVLLVPSH